VLFVVFLFEFRNLYATLYVMAELNSFKDFVNSRGVVVNAYKTYSDIPLEDLDI